MNVRLLRRVKRAILDEPGQFVMDAFFTTDTTSEYTSDLPRKTIPNCETAACIGGWALAISGKQTPQACSNDGDTMDYSSEAARVLDLDYGQGARLFYVERWPQVFQDQWIRTETLKGRARMAARRIEHFIREGV